LRAAGVICDNRPGLIRLSPHYFNTLDEMDRTLALLASLRVAPRRLSQVIHRGRLIAWSIFFAWLAIPSYALRLSGRLEVLPVDALFRYSTAVGAIVVDPIQLVLVLVIARKLPFRETVALRRPPSWSRAAAIGVVTIVLAYTVAYLEERVFPDLLREQGIPVYWDGVRAAAWLANLFAIAVFAP